MKVPRWWIAAALVGFGGSIAICFLPADATVAAAIYQGIALGVVALLGFGVARMPRSARPVWWAVLGYAILTNAGDVIYHLMGKVVDPVPYPGAADVAYLAGYLAAGLAVGLIIHGARRARRPEAWIDAAIIALGAASIVVVLVVEPILNQGSVAAPARALSLAYVVLDLVLLAGLGRIVVGRGHPNLALVMVSLAYATTLIADLLLADLTSQSPENQDPVWLGAIYLAAFVTMGLAVHVPGATRLGALTTERIDDDPVPHDTVAVALMLGALTVPAVLTYAAWSGADAAPALALLSVASVLVIGLALWRFRLLLGVAEELAGRLTDLARTDALTGLPNRRSLDFELERAERTARETAAPLTIAMLDLDHFKAYNDAHGHRQGDAVLAACAAAWSALVDGAGLMARYGGEEFAILLPGSAAPEATALLEALRASTPGPVTVSIGVAELGPTESAYDTLSRADRALYRAKDLGRDRLVSSDDLNAIDV